MRAVLHKDRVKARIVRHDRKNRPEGRVTEIIERSPNPLIGRLLQESGVWLVAPEDKRYGQDVLIPKGATGSAKTGQVVVVQLTEPPALGRKGGVGRSYADAPEIDGVVKLLAPEKISKTLKVGEFTKARIVGVQGHDLIGVPF